MRRSTASPSWPYSPATKRRNSTPVSLSYTNGRSGMKPSRILAGIGFRCTSSPPSSTRPFVYDRVTAGELLRLVAGRRDGDGEELDGPLARLPGAGELAGGAPELGGRRAQGERAAQ